MFFVLKCTTSLTDINKSKERKLRVLHLTITIIKGWATRAPVAQTLQSVRQTCPRTTCTCLCVHVCTVSILWNFLKPTRTVASETTKLKQQGDGAGET